MAATELADDGTQIPVYSIAMAFAYVSGNLSTITIQYAGNTYVQTFTYSGADVTNISLWVKQ